MDKFEDNCEKNIREHMNLLKLNSTQLKKSVFYLMKCGKCIDDMIIEYEKILDPTKIEITFNPNDMPDKKIENLSNQLTINLDKAMKEINFLNDLDTQYNNNINNN